MTFGNGVVLSQSFDQDYQLTSIGDCRLALLESFVRWYSALSLFDPVRTQVTNKWGQSRFL